jgi:hypothetical protein
MIVHATPTRGPLAVWRACPALGPSARDFVLLPTQGGAFRSDLVQSTTRIFKKLGRNSRCIYFLRVRPILYHEYYRIQYFTGFTPIAPPGCNSKPGFFSQNAPLESDETAAVRRSRCAPSATQGSGQSGKKVLKMHLMDVARSGSTILAATYSRRFCDAWREQRHE